jgi:hypothetical protein
MQASIGRIVHYTLTDQDAAAIHSARSDFRDGNSVEAAQVYPAMVTRVWNDGDPEMTVNLQVFLDGNDAYWATSRAEGEGPGCWTWPARAEEPEVPEQDQVAGTGGVVYERDPEA